MYVVWKARRKRAPGLLVDRPPERIPSPWGLLVGHLGMLPHVLRGAIRKFRCLCTDINGGGGGVGVALLQPTVPQVAASNLGCMSFLRRRGIGDERKGTLVHVPQIQHWS